MPVEVKDVDGGLGNIIIYSGVITKEEFVTTLKQHLMQDKDKFKNYRYSLNDASAVIKVEFSAEEIGLVANFCKSASTVNSTAIVATVADKDFVYGLARMSDALRNEAGWENEVFRNLDEAKSWIKKRVSGKFGIEDLRFG